MQLNIYKYWIPNEEYVEQYADKATEKTDVELFNEIDDEAYDEALDLWNQDFPQFKHLSKRQFLEHMWVWTALENAPDGYR
jgi:hypothetical protein